ncbi:putative amino acid protein [Botryosphaeria dothidea]|uniref:Amino acid protein n=1 Tax=Botryosphaeria dothidea TaxID=55169 RepID=A0A8H4J529_9PEZI|nr:putative amino acid protein [Botryosphaeria dothidea]
MDSVADEKAPTSPHTADVEKPPSHVGVVSDEVDQLAVLGYKPELQRNRSMFHLLFQTLSIAAIPYGEGGPLISAIYGGGPLSIFVGWIVVLVLDECVALSLSELASRYPTSAGPYYWTFQLAPANTKTVLSFINGWTWLIGNWTITLSVNFGFASLIAATVSMYHEDFVATDWQLLLIFYAICIITFFICAFGNRFLPLVDTMCAAWTAVSIFIILIALSVSAKEGRHSASYALGHYDTSFSGWGSFTFFIGLLPAAYTFSALGMISSMAEEVHDPAIKVPQAISLCIPVGGIFGIFFILPICFTLPPLADILEAPNAQALPYIFHRVMGSPVPLARIWSRVDDRFGVPIWSLVLITLVQMLLGLINLGSTSAFTAFVSVGVIALALSYAFPIAISLLHKRREVARARFHCGSLIGTTVNLIALAWIAFELVLFSMPTALPVDKVTMNYASVVLAGFLAISAVWYMAHSRTYYKGPPTSDGLVY